MQWTKVLSSPTIIKNVLFHQQKGSQVEGCCQDWIRTSPHDDCWKVSWLLEGFFRSLQGIDFSSEVVSESSRPNSVKSKPCFSGAKEQFPNMLRTFGAIVFSFDRIWHNMCKKNVPGLIWVSKSLFHRILEQEVFDNSFNYLSKTSTARFCNILLPFKHNLDLNIQKSTFHELWSNLIPIQIINEIWASRTLPWRLLPKLEVDYGWLLYVTVRFSQKQKKKFPLKMVGWQVCLFLIRNIKMSCPNNFSGKDEFQIHNDW